MRRLMVVAAMVSAAAAGLVWWRRHRRFGATYVNRVVDPWLVRHGVVDESEGELALLEHVGRRSGTVRVTPVHPVRTETGFRIIVPLGTESHWAQNVLAAGHCRLQVGDIIHELDEPALIVPSAVTGMPTVVGRAMDWLDFRYLVLRQFAEHAGTLEVAPEPSEQAQPEPVAVG